MLTNQAFEGPKHTLCVFPLCLSIFGKIEKHEKVRALYRESIMRVIGWLVNDGDFGVNGLSVAGQHWHTGFSPALST